MVKAPNKIVAGETFLVQCDDLNYGTVTIALRGPSSVNAEATLNTGDYWQFALDSINWNPGNYQFEIWGTQGDVRQFIGRFPLTVIASLVGVNGAVDLRSDAEKNVQALETYLAGIGDPEADQSVSRYRINNREIFSYPIPELQRLLAFWRKRLIRERRAQRGLHGDGPSIKAHI